MGMSGNKSYWEKRHGQWIANQDKMDDSVSAKLAKEYTRTSRELENEIASYFQKYGQDDVIEFRTMMQGLSEKDRDLLFQDMDRFAKKYPEYEDLMPVRESVYKLNRLQGLHYSTQMKLLELGAIEQKEMEKHLEKTYGKRYDEIMKELGIGNSFLSINDEIMKDTIYSKWVNGENFSDRIWKNKEKLLNQLQTRYRDGLARGDNYAKLSKEIQDRFSVGANDARRLVWTEASFVLNQSHSHAYIDSGVEEYELNALLDNKTSRICRSMDGKRFRFDEMEVGVNFPPFHGYCRTTFIGVLEERQESQENNDLVNYFNEADGDRKVFAEKLLSSYGIDVPVEIEETDARGYNQFLNFGEGKRADISRFVLQKGDDRSSDYQFKTALHEAYHSKLKGLEVPISSGFDINKWTAIEETMTESAAHYQMSLLTDKPLMPAYSNYLSVNLPKMQKLKEFEGYTDFLEFGKKAMDYRFDDNERTTDWRQLHKEIEEVEFDFNQYIKDNYVEDLKSRKDEVLNMVYENSPAFERHHEAIKKDYDNFIFSVEESRGYFYGNEEMIGKQAVTALYRLVGVKSWK